MSKDREVDIDDIFNRWVGDVTDYGQDRGAMYSKSNRRENIDRLFSRFKLYGVSHDDAKFLKRRVIKELVREDGRKAAGKKNDRLGTWEPNASLDYDNALLEYYNPNAGLEIENVVFKNSSFQIPKNGNIVEWVKNKYGDNEQIIEEAHNVNSSICLEYFEELERRNLR